MVSQFPGGRRLLPALQESREAAAVARGDDLLVRVRDLEGRALRILDRAERRLSMKVAATLAVEAMLKTEDA